MPESPCDAVGDGAILSGPSAPGRSRETLRRPRIEASGTHPLERMATLCAIGDFASVYLALVCGVDPCEITPITSLKQRIAR